MESRFMRTAALLGEEKINNLKNARIAIFGIGGVGAAALEALVRAGVGTVDVFDNDTVNITNLNRQLIATENVIGELKTDAAEKRAKLINPNVIINKFNIFFLPETSDNVDLSIYDYIIDAVDTVSAKLELAKKAYNLNIPIISVMGTGNKLDPTKITVSDIFKTYECPLCRVMRTELKRLSINKLTCVWSPEKPLVPVYETEKRNSGRPTPASAPFVPIAAGVAAAAYVVKNITNNN